MASTTVSGKQTARTTPGKLISVSVGTAPTYGKYSVHDCVDPALASALNCVYPQNFGSADGITMKNGIVVMTVDGSGSFTVMHSS